MSSITVLDRLINKPVSVEVNKDISYNSNTYIVYKDNEGKEYIGEMLGYSTNTEKKGSYVRTLTGREKERFDANKQKAKEYFSTFSKKFKEAFPTSVPITSRISLHGNHIYFYFFAEQRFDFSSFVRELRAVIPMRFFIYQVGARDRVRLHENLHERYDSNGLPLMYNLFKHPLDQVEGDVVSDQGLRGRSAERLKDRSGKFDHTLNFEQYIYKEEIPKYPQKGEILHFEGKKVKCNGFNILTQEIKLRGEDSSTPGVFTGEFITTTLEELENDKKKTYSTQRSPKKSSRPPRKSTTNDKKFKKRKRIPKKTPGKEKGLTKRKTVTRVSAKI